MRLDAAKQLIIDARDQARMLVQMYRNTTIPAADRAADDARIAAAHQQRIVTELDALLKE
jgi:hypothetical protein